MEAPGKEYKNRLRRLGYTNHEIIDMVQNKEETLDDLVNDLFWKHADDFSGTHMSMDYDGFKAALKEVLNKLRSNV